MDLTPDFFNDPPRSSEYLCAKGRALAAHMKAKAVELEGLTDIYCTLGSKKWTVQLASRGKFVCTRNGKPCNRSGRFEDEFSWDYRDQADRLGLMSNLRPFATPEPVGTRWLPDGEEPSLEDLA